MAYDIYGNDLRKGYCEVHPNVHEEYPCELCLLDKSDRNTQTLRYTQIHPSLENLMNEFIEFSIKTFKNATEYSSLEKLQDEFIELSHELMNGNKQNIAEEYVDCIMCLVDSAARTGITPGELTKIFEEKLAINKSRTWKENPDKTYSHVK